VVDQDHDYEEGDEDEDRVAKYPTRPAMPTTPSHGNNPV
jgi:hypothetical protein